MAIFAQFEGETSKNNPERAGKVQCWPKNGKICFKMTILGRGEAEERSQVAPVREVSKNSKNLLLTSVKKTEEESLFGSGSPTFHQPLVTTSSR